MEIDSNNVQRQFQRQIQQQQQQQQQRVGDASPTASNNDSGEVAARAAAENESRGNAGRELLGQSTSAGAERREPPQPSGNGDPSAIYRDGDAPGGGRPRVPRAGTGGSAPARMAQRVLRKIASAVENRPPPPPPAAAGAAVANAADPRGAAQKIADRAGVGALSGVPMGRANENRRAHQISDDLQAGRTPTPFRGREVEVSTTERRALAGNDPVARKQTADDVGRREAQRDSLVQAAGTKERAAAMEQAYQRATTEQRAQDARQRDPEQVRENLAGAGEALATVVGGGPVRAGIARALQGPAGAAARRAYEQVRQAVGGGLLPRAPGGGASGATKPRAPRTEAQKERRRELERARRAEERAVAARIAEQNRANPL